jgi:hypothetical protein
MIPGLQNYGSGIYVTCFSLKSDIEKRSENLQVEVVNLQCDTNLNQVICERKYKRFLIFICQKKNFLYSGL